MPKPSIWRSILLYLSLFLLLGTISVFVILDNFQKTNTLTLQDLEEHLNRLKTGEELELEAKLLGSEKKIKDFSFIFAKHRRASKFFPVIENLCHPRVQFSDLNLNLDSSEASVSGQTESFEILGQQLIIFREAKELKNVELGEATIGEGGKIDFSFTFSLNPEIFK